MDENTKRSIFVQRTDTLHLSCSLRFSDKMKETYTKAFHRHGGKNP